MLLFPEKKTDNVFQQLVALLIIYSRASFPATPLEGRFFFNERQFGSVPY